MGKLSSISFATAFLTAWSAQSADLGSFGRTAPAPAEHRWYIHAGPGGVFLSESATMRALGAPIPGADISIAPQFTPIVELGYMLTPNIGVSFTGGLPPKIKVKGEGSVAGLGTLGTAIYGPMTLTAHYHFDGLGPIRPYIGAGLAYMKVFDTSDRAVTNLSMDDTFGPALQIGVEWMFDQRWGAFIDVKKAFLSTKAHGTLGGVPISAKATLDPLVVHTGLVFRF